VSKFPLNHFLGFLKALRVDTKERGVISLGDNLIGTQTWVLRELVKGLESGQHEMVILKCRQIGVSTLTLALDLYWLFRHKGMTGALITHDEPARDQFRATLQMYYDGLEAKWKQPIVQNNRNQLVLRTGTRMSYRVAGTRAKGGGSLGRSAALSFVHATEIGFWGDPEGLSSLRSSLAERNENRLYVWESTANGFNHWYDMWMDGKTSVTQRCVFVSWWANEMYRAPRGDAVWRSYWGQSGRPTGEEKAWAKDVKKLYDVDIDDEQFAWYRWLASEKVTDEMMRTQEFPHTEYDAFIASGSQFFTVGPLGEAMKAVKRVSYEAYRISVSSDVRDTSVLPLKTKGAAKNANLWVYEKPEAGGVYVIGADPSYASSEDADRSVVSVWRAYADKMVQVAEFVDNTIPTYQFAWILVYLAGAYGRRDVAGGTCVVNLEVNGPGEAVLNEIQNLKKQRVSEAGHGDRSLQNVMGNMSEYLYRKYDGLMGGPIALHTKTSLQVKERFMNAYRDYFERGMIEVRSVGLIEEMKEVVREAGAAPAAPESQNDDRVIAAALATMAWNDQVRQQLINKGITHDFVEKRVNNPQVGVTERTVSRFMQEIGVLRPVTVKKPTVSWPGKGLN
jgi:hypothetical protein